MLDKIVERLTAHTVLITPTAILQAYLLQAYASSSYLNREFTALPCVTLSAWYALLWQEYEQMAAEHAGYLLTHQQELAIWYQLITQAALSYYTTPKVQLAHAAQQTWHYLQQYCLDYRHAQWQLHDNAQVFQGLAAQFVHLCATQHWVDHSSLPRLLGHQIVEQGISMPRHVLLINFMDHTPQEQALWAACQAVGTQVESISLGGPASTVPVSTSIFRNSYDELYAMCHWAEQVKRRDPSSIVACYMPNLAHQDSLLRRVTSAISGNRQRFNSIDCRNLATSPLSKYIMHWLKLPLDEVPVQELSIILNSPFLRHTAVELPARMVLDKVLRAANQLTYTWAELHNILLANACGYVAELSAAYYALRIAQPSQQSLDAWAQLWGKLLAEALVPAHDLIEDAAPAMLAWQELLAQVAQLAIVVPAPLNYYQALHYLALLLQHAEFKPLSPLEREAGINLTGCLDASIVSDYLWLSGMDHQAWPPPAAPNIFIPYNATYLRAGARAQDSLAYHAQVWQQLWRQTGKMVHISCVGAEHLGERKLAKIFADFPSINESADESLLHMQEAGGRVAEISAITEIADEVQVVDGLGQDATALSKILALQALCPFKAFAKLRLKAYKVRPYPISPSATPQHFIIVQVLGLLWAELQDQAALQQLDPALLRAKVAGYLTTVRRSLQPKGANMLAVVEHDAVLDNILRWLEFEAKRPFFRVLGHQVSLPLPLGDSLVHAEVERLDQVAGQDILIKYTTAKLVSVNDALKQPLKDPIPALYSLLRPGAIVAYACLGTHQPQLMFLPELDRLTGQQYVQGLWSDFHRGLAKVAPIDANQCYSCDLPSLCRINEL